MGATQLSLHKAFQSNGNQRGRTKPADVFSTHMASELTCDKGKNKQGERSW